MRSDLFSAYLSRGQSRQEIRRARPQFAGWSRDHRRVSGRYCDVVVENFSVGAAKRLGFDFERLSSINPRLIYCSITGFGQTGPHKDKPGYDLLVQAMGGLMSITGSPRG